MSKIIEIFELILRTFGLNLQEHIEFRKDPTIDIRYEAEKYKFINEDIYDIIFYKTTNYNIDYYKVTYKSVGENGKDYYRWIYLLVK